MAVIVEVMVHEIVRGDVGGRGIERPEAQYRAPCHVEPAALEDPLVQMVVDHYGVEETEEARRAKERDVSTRRHKHHRREEREIRRDDADLSKLGGVLEQITAHRPVLAFSGVSSQALGLADERRLLIFLRARTGLPQPAFGAFDPTEL